MLGQQTLPAPLCLPRPCFKGLTCVLCPLPSVSLPHHRDIIRNCAVSVDQIQDLHSPMSPISENPASPAYSTGRHRPSVPLGTVGLWISLDLALLRCRDLRSGTFGTGPQPVLGCIIVQLSWDQLILSGQRGFP